ncbi:MAG TPA: hypothetical protein VKU38_14255 [Ktedonobacteraceae bacterium]|nr:hypothetical protein [Ktedonobacteraceae bacterium]
MVTQKMRFSSFIMTLILSLLLFGAMSGSVIASTVSTCGSWKIIPSPNLTRNNSLAAVRVLSSSDIWAVGQVYQTPHSTVSQILTEHWNGMQWSILTSPHFGASSSLLAVTAVSPSDVWAVGFTGTRTLAEHWNGSSWQVFSSPSTGQSDVLEGVQALSSNNVWAVGVTNSSNGTSKTLIEHWNGTLWSIVSSPNVGSGDDLHAIAALAPNNIWAVGDNDTSTALTEHWDGSHWNIVQTPSIGIYARLSSVSVITSNNIWATGYANTSGGYKTLVEHWNGTVWSPITSPNPGPYDDMLNAVSAISAKNIWAVGSYRDAKHIYTNIPFALHWNGSKWSVVKTPNPGSYLYYLAGLAQIPGTNMLWAVGSWQYHNLATVKTLTELYC